MTLYVSTAILGFAGNELMLYVQGGVEDIIPRAKNLIVLNILTQPPLPCNLDLARKWMSRSRGSQLQTVTIGEEVFTVSTYDSAI